MRTTVIFHAGDYDGIFCREIARKFLPPDTEFIGWDFADKPLTVPDGRIYVLDLPVDRVFGLDFSKGCVEAGDIASSVLSRLVWVDHHKSSIETHPTEIPGYRIDGVAACRLCWAYFTHPASPFNAKP